MVGCRKSVCGLIRSVTDRYETHNTGEHVECQATTMISRDAVTADSDLELICAVAGSFQSLCQFPPFCCLS